MSIFDLRARVGRAVLSWGGLVDPASYVAAHASTVGTSGTLSFKPDGSRGPFLAWGLQRSSSTLLSRMTLSVESRRLTPAAVAYNALCHLSTFTGQGIDLSQWPAPLLIDQGQAASLYEEAVVAATSPANIVYALVGFHTDAMSYARVKAEFGEFRAFGLEVACDFSVASGRALDRYTATEALTVVEYLTTNYADPATTPIDSIRVRLDDRELLQGDRTTTTTVGAAGPVRLGIPASYIGVDVQPGQTFQVSSKISASTRRDAWSFLAVAR